MKAVRVLNLIYPELIEIENRLIFKLWDTTKINSYSNITEEEKRIMMYFTKFKQINNKDAREKLGFTKNGAIKVFKSLIEKQYISQSGKGSSTNYTINYSKEDNNHKVVGGVSELLSIFKHEL